MLKTAPASSLARQVARWPARGPVRVLLVLDQPLVTELVKLTLNHGAYHTRTTVAGAEAVTALGSWHPHLALVDMDLGRGNIVHELAATGDGGRVPLIALTRRSDLRTKLAAFDAGADDILTVPFAAEELLARVVALVRRSYTDAVTFTPMIKVGQLEIDILRRTVHNGATELHLTSLEQSLLYLLAANAGRVVTRDEILDTLWGTDYVAESNIVDRQIRNLRARLQDNWRAPQFIVTVPGRGYQFLAPSPAYGDAAAS
jgi:two-component system, OmpR family, KDP operon response regulator KdpE